MTTVHHRLLVPLAALVLLASGCRSFKREFDPPLITQNDVVKMSVRKLSHKKTSLRIWLSLENLTEQVLQMQYGNFTIVSNGQKLRGALRVPFVRIDKGFEMPARYFKYIGQPIEFIGVEKAAEIELAVTGVHSRGGPPVPDLNLTVPVYGMDR